MVAIEVVPALSVALKFIAISSPPEYEFRLLLVFKLTVPEFSVNVSSSKVKVAGSPFFSLTESSKKVVLCVVRAASPLSPVIEPGITVPVLAVLIIEKLSCVMFSSGPVDISNAVIFGKLLLTVNVMLEESTVVPANVPLKTAI